MKKRICLLMRWALVGSVDVQAAEPTKPTRSASTVREFKRINPCPETGDRRGSCPGWIIDHVVPLYAGGPDRPDNMQWPTVDDGKTNPRSAGLSE